MGDTIIECRNVTYTYPLQKEPSVKDLNISIERGKFYGVIGENGAGKSTFCELLRGFIPQFFKGELVGEVLVDGKKTVDYGGELATKMGYVFQNPFTQMSGVKDTVFEEVAYGLENFGIAVPEIEDRVQKVMQQTDIEYLAMKNPFELSGGQMQRVALASVIVLNPEILIIDEPTSQLDPQGTESVFKIISDLKKQEKTIILVEHKADLIAEYADEVIAFEKGHIIASGDKAKILSDISLIEHGVALPQSVLLGNALIKAGYQISGIPFSDEEAVRMIREAKKKAGDHADVSSGV